MVKKKTLLFLWLASFAFASRDDDIRATQRRRRLGRDKENKNEDFTREPTGLPSVGPVSVPPSISPSKPLAANPATATEEVQLATPSAAPAPETPLSNSFLSPALFHEDSSAATTPTTSVSSQNTTAPNDKQLVLLVLNSWMDPEVLQVALRLYENDRTVNLEIVLMRYEPDGVAYELSVRNSSAWLTEDPDSRFVKSLNRFLDDAFPDVRVLRIDPVTENNEDLTSDLIRSSDEAELSNNDKDDTMLILAVVLSISAFCCCVGISLFLLPSYCQFRRELREAWTFNESKEHRVLQEMGTEDTEE